MQGARHLCRFDVRAGRACGDCERAWWRAARLLYEGMILLRVPFAFLVFGLVGLLGSSSRIRAAEVAGGEFKVVANLAYKSGAGLSEYEQQRCKLDLVLPVGRTNFATLVWFHGGGLTGGSKSEGFAKQLARAFGVAVAAANYRLSPQATYPAYVEDAAAAVAWVHGNIGAHGGDTNLVFVGGHSAGAYLTSMVGLDVRLLAKHGLGAGTLAGLIPVSGQTMTHFTVRTERGLGKNNLTADEAAPIYYVRAETPPMLMIMGDNDWPARAEENQYFVAAMKVAGNQRVTYRQFADRTHGTIGSKLVEAGDPAGDVIRAFLDECRKGRVGGGK